MPLFLFLCLVVARHDKGGKEAWVWDPVDRRESVRLEMTGEVDV